MSRLERSCYFYKSRESVYGTYEYLVVLSSILRGGSTLRHDGRRTLEGPRQSGMLTVQLIIPMVLTESDGLSHSFISPRDLDFINGP